MYSLNRSAARPTARVLAFVLRQWRDHPTLTCGVAAPMVAATQTHVFLPIYAGNLVSAISAATNGHDSRALHGAGLALAVMVALGLGQQILRYGAFIGIVRLTTAVMSEVARAAFHRVQRFSSDWHANTFAGSVVRKVTRGMWALDTLNDTLLIALLPAVAVLVGSAIVLGLRWPSMGLLLAVGAALYLLLAVTLSVLWVAPASQLSNRWDTRVGGVLADAITCNPVVKAFGAEAREDARLDQTLGKWAGRTGRTWSGARSLAPSRALPSSSCVRW
jgi:ATP-binding cassette subfamily B protein